MNDSNTGTLYIVAAPSGGGKTTLVQHLVKSLDNIEVSISHTTRPRRPSEVEGQHYFFVSEEKFAEMINDNAFIEHARVFDNLYGTSVAQISQRLAMGIDIVLDIDWQGADQIRRLFPDAISVFVIPPSVEVLKARLTSRGQDEADVILDRMHRAQEEISHYGEFDYLIVNDEFEVAARELAAIVTANRLKMARQSLKQAKLLSFLLA